jgi:UDP-glucose 4-epimerase
MNILVTGGAGYIGSHVVRLLLEKGHRVVIFDDLSTGHAESVPAEAVFVRGDLLDPAAVDALFRAHGPHEGAPTFDGIMHFASRILVGESMQQPWRYFRENVNTVINVLEAATAYGVGRFILSSTAALFDRPARIPIDETERVIPGSVYGETKSMAERMLYWADQIYGLKYCALRYFNASGAHPDGHIGEDHQPESHLIPIILQVALGQREKLTVYGDNYATPDGTPIRDYIHVMDLAEAHILALEALGSGPSRVYNLGYGHGYSVLEVVEAARRVTGHPIPLEVGPRRPGDLDALVADSARIHGELGWEPAYDDLDTIIGTAWAWHRAHPHGYAKR